MKYGVSFVQFLTYRVISSSWVRRLAAIETSRESLWMKGEVTESRGDWLESPHQASDSTHLWSLDHNGWYGILKEESSSLSLNYCHQTCACISEKEKNRSEREGRKGRREKEGEKEEKREEEKRKRREILPIGRALQAKRTSTIARAKRARKILTFFLLKTLTTDYRLAKGGRRISSFRTSRSTMIFRDNYFLHISL